MSRLHTLKAALLAFLIVTGFALQTKSAHATETETIVLAGGCFWCVESDFERVPGVKDVISGYANGTTLNSGERSGPRESVRVEFDPTMISHAQLYHMFFRSIDPTDNGGQFCDRGSTYRTAIFALDDDQSQSAIAAKKSAQDTLSQNVVTNVFRFEAFNAANKGHQDYYKGTNRVLTRFGAIKQSDAYKRYRKGCGRDARVEQLWGNDAPFVNH